MRPWMVYTLSISLFWFISCSGKRDEVDKNRPTAEAPAKPGPIAKKTPASETVVTPIPVNPAKGVNSNTDAPSTPANPKTSNAIRADVRPMGKSDKPTKSPTVPAAQKCDQRISSNLPGASIHVTSKRCVFSLAEVSTYVETPYELHIEQPLRAVKPYKKGDPLVIPWPSTTGHYARGCPSPKDQSNIVIAQRVAVTNRPEEVGYCDCNMGHCRPNSAPPRDLEPATYRYKFRWIGQRYQGFEFRYVRSSGKPLPPGNYEIRLRSNGTYLPQDATSPRPFHIETVFPITIVP
jgi:hypothetical protein